jgi:hypothetical protein
MPAPGVAFRRVPWTCQWGEFSGAVSRVTPGGQTQVLCGGQGWTPWTCLNADVRPAGEYLRKGDCDHCPFWTLRVDRAAS